jgi:hypothetical protein
MRNFDLVERMSSLGEDIQTILEYLALNKEHFVSYFITNPNGRILVKNHIRMSDDGDLIRTVELEDLTLEPEKTALNLSLFKAIIADSKQSAPSEEYTETFANKWDEIQKVTNLNVAQNRMIER